MKLFSYLFIIVFTLQVCFAEPVIDVDIESTNTSFTYTADVDSQQLEYSCVSNGSADGLIWRYNNIDYTNPINAYRFYGVVRSVGTYSIGCYSGGTNIGDMELTLMDIANFTVEYSGSNTVYPLSSGNYHTVSIPVDTPDVTITCEVSKGFMFVPPSGIIPSTANPSTTFTLTNTTGSGLYKCVRDVFGLSIVILTLDVSPGAAVTTTLTTTQSSTTPVITTNTTSTTTTTTTQTPTTAQTTPTTVPITTTTTTQTTVPTIATPTITSSTPPITITTITTNPTATSPLTSIITPIIYETTSITTTNTTDTSPTTRQQPSADMTGVIIGILLLLTIIIITTITAGVIGLCLWKYYSGFKQKTYRKQDDEVEHRNGSMLREMNTSPKQFLSVAGPYYESLPTQFIDDTSHSIALEEFKSQLDLLWGNDCKLLTTEYTSLGQSELRYPTEAAREHITDGKNRYKNIYPYDKSRVHLVQRVEGSDYVNASYIPGVLVPEMFIASQAPKKETMLEFWEMLWQKRISNVVMLTKIMEGNKKKCESYLPERTGDTIGVGDILVTLLKVQSDYDQTIRLLEIKNKRDITTIFKMKHFHFSGWPDHEAPRFAQGLLNFIVRVKSDRVVDNSPICTHCSAGVGRTGAFIALYNLIDEIKKSAPFSIFNIVNEMREHRPHMVQTFTQYKFIYLSCLELIHGDTVLPASNYSYVYRTCLEAKPSVLRMQLEEIDYFSEKSFSRSFSEALSPRNASLNPEMSVLPYDDYRPILSTPAWGVGGYINASYVDGFQGFQDIIATQHPNVFTARHMVQLIFQTECPLVIALTSPEEYADMGYEHGRIIYWPEPTTQHEFDGFVLKNLSQKQEQIMEFLLIDTNENMQHRFNIIISLDWDVGGAAMDQTNVFGIVHEMISVKANFPRNPIIVHCEDGAGKTGVLLSVYNAMTQITLEKQVDIFQIVKCLRYCRPRMVNSLIQYNSVHSVINQHLAPNTYENLSAYRQ